MQAVKMETFILSGDACAELKRIAGLPVKYHNIIINNPANANKAVQIIAGINPNYEIKITPEEISAKVDFAPPYRLGKFNTTDAMVRVFSKSNLYVNIGANDGISYGDCCYPLYLNGYTGFAFDKSLCKQHRENIDEEKVPLIEELLTHENTSKIFTELNIPESFALLKIDIDSYDGELLEHILELGYRPDFIDIEINPEFPPPVKFSIKSASDKYGIKVNGGLYGSSPSYVYEVGLKYGYKLAQLTFGKYTCLQEMVLVRDGIDMPKRQLVEAYNENTMAPLHLSNSKINAQLWLKVPEHELLNKIKEDLKVIKVDHTLQYALYI